MELLEIILIGVTLAIDAFAVTIANCATYKKSLSPLKEWSMPITFAFFQILMPVIGYYIGSLFKDYLSSIAKFISSGIFFILCAKIVIDNIKELKEKDSENTKQASNKPFGIGVLLIQGIATSIDALAIGVAFSLTLSMNIFLASGIIGIVTFIIVAVALLFGKVLGKVFGKYAEWAGALILFGIAIKSLIEALIEIL